LVSRHLVKNENFLLNDQCVFEINTYFYY
jgi:hypothetical protein